jgi:hypothetical protein
MPTDAFLAFILNPESEKEYLVELDGAYDTGSGLDERSFYFSKSGAIYNGIYYFPAIKDIPRISRKVQILDGGASFPSWGNLVLNTQHDFYITPDRDVVFNDLKTDWVLTGRDAKILLGGKGLDYADYEPVFNGKMGYTRWSDATLQAPCIDGIQDLRECKLPANQFAEGGAMPAATAGQFIPVCIGEHSRIAPVLVNTNNLVYQVHDPDILGAIEDITAVYDAGTSVSFTKDLANCRFTLSTAPSGTVTCDVKGAKYDGAYIEKVGDVVEALVDYAGLSSKVDATLLSGFKTDMDVKIKLFLETQENIQQVLDRAVKGLPAWYGFDRSGSFQIREFTLSGTPVLDLSPLNILEKSLNGEFSKELWYNISMGWGHDWEEKRYRYYTGTPDSDLLALCPWAKTRRIQSYLTDKTDAQTVHAKWKAIRGARRQRYTVTTKMQAVQLILGDIVSLTWPEFGMDAQNFVIVGMEENLIQGRVKMEVLG